MKNETKNIGINSVIKIVAEKAVGQRIIIQKRFLSAIPGEELFLPNPSSFGSGLNFALNLLETDKRITKGESASLQDSVIVVPAESAFDDDIQEMINNAVNGTNLLVICFNQQASLSGWACSATPKGARTINFPVYHGKKGNPFLEKPLCRILAAAGADYVAQTSAFFEEDFKRKLQKALSYKGFRFINCLTPVSFWGYSPEKEEEVGNLAHSTGHFPHFEIEKGVLSTDNKSVKPQSLTKYFDLQKRFRHLNLPGNRKLLNEIQHIVQINWEQLRG